MSRILLGVVLALVLLGAVASIGAFADACWRLCGG